MITIGYNQVQEKHVADSNSTRREDAHEAKKVYVGNKLAHVHVNDNTEFALRQTLNGYIHEDNDLYAKIRSIRGNTKVWNQLVQNPTFVDSSAWSSLSSNVNIADNIATITKTSDDRGGIIYQNVNSLTTTHKYYIAATVKADSVAMHFGFHTTNGILAGNTDLEYNLTSWGTVKAIVSPVNSTDFIAVRVGVAADPIGSVGYAKDVNVIDLTLIYGAGNEPTTVAEFEADFQQWFGRPIGAEPYDAGSLIPFVGTGIKSTGFNLWDEEWEVGGIDSNGANIYSTSTIRSKNYIRVEENTEYWIGTKLPSDGAYCYDTNKAFIGMSPKVNSKCIIRAGTKYIRFRTVINYGTTYNHDICINLSNPTLNGTYVPYKATTVPIPVTTLTGKAEGSTTSEVIFPDGMKSAGSVKDEVYVEDGKTYAVKRVGSVDLGILIWNKQTDGGSTANLTYFRAIITNRKIGTSMNIVCPKYLNANGPTRADLRDKTIGQYNITENKVAIMDSTYDSYTATDFGTAMSGVMLYYELATPIVYEVDNYTLPLYYPANGTGTEELLSTATSAPADMDIEYRLRQRVRLVDMGTPGVLWADSDIDITKPDGFCDSPFTYDKSFFSWGNVVGHNPISNTAFDYDWGSVNQAEPWYEGQPYDSTPGNTLTGNIPADAQYDAAKAVLGCNWRMPSNAEYGNLFSICKFLEADGSDMDTSKTDKRVDMPNGNGGTVKGIYIESTITGNRLFFSCSGVGLDRSWYNRGSNGYYWSSMFSSARYARSLYFSSGGVNPSSNDNRFRGFALRPVYPISQ